MATELLVTGRRPKMKKGLLVLAVALMTRLTMLRLRLGADRVILRGTIFLKTGST